MPFTVVLKSSSHGNARSVLNWIKFLELYANCFFSPSRERKRARLHAPTPRSACCGVKPLAARVRGWGNKFYSLFFERFLEHISTRPYYFIFLFETATVTL